VVELDTLPPPAVTELLTPPADDDVFGGLSPGFKCTSCSCYCSDPSST